MRPVRDVVADNVRSILLVAGIGLVLLGGVGSGPVGPAAVLGLVVLLTAVFLSSPLAELLETDGDTETKGSVGDTETDGPVGDLREQYVAGELSEEEFERRVETALADAKEPDGTDAAESTVSDASQTALEERSEDGQRD